MKQLRYVKFKCEFNKALAKLYLAQNLTIDKRARKTKDSTLRYAQKKIHFQSLKNV